MSDLPAFPKTKYKLNYTILGDDSNVQLNTQFQRTQSERTGNISVSLLPQIVESEATRPYRVTVGFSSDFKFDPKENKIHFHEQEKINDLISKLVTEIDGRNQAQSRDDTMQVQYSVDPEKNEVVLTAPRLDQISVALTRFHENDLSVVNDEQYNNLSQNLRDKILRANAADPKFNLPRAPQAKSGYGLSY